MVRYDEEHKKRVRKRLLAGAARMVRQDGIASVTVGRVMAKAKMTVGGFYRHFPSRSALVGEALAEALLDARPLVFSGLESLRGEDFESGFVNRYLSDSHYENVAGGCPIAANVSEIARNPRLARGPLAAEVRSFMAFVEERVRPAPSPVARAWTLVACCVGGLALSRAMGREHGPRVLVSIRTTLLGLVSAPQ